MLTASETRRDSSSPEPADEGRRPRRVATSNILIGTAALLLYVLGTVLRENWYLDDALIYQNYVRNALLGHGLMYFPGEAVEGYSSPLWVLLLIVMGATGLTGLGAAKILGALCGLACCLALFALPTRRQWLAPLGALVLAGQTSLQWYAVSGMETALIALLTATLAIALIRNLPLLATIAAGLAAIARPEGAIYLVPLLYWLWAAARRGDLPRSRAVGLAALAFAPALGWQLFRAVTYGTLVANSALAKIGLDMAAVTADGSKGLPYLLAGVREAPGVWLLIAAALPALLLGRRDDAERDTHRALLLGLALALIFAAMFGDWMPRSRLLLPALPLLLAWTLYASQSLPQAWRRLDVAVVGLAIVLTLLQQLADLGPRVINGQYFRPAWPHQRAPYIGALPADPHTHQIFARYMLRYTIPGDRVLLHHVGQPGYLFGDVQIMDPFGLVSRKECEFLNRRLGEQDYLAYFESAAPAVAFMQVDGNGSSRLEIPRVAGEALAKGYALAAQIPWAHADRMNVYVRKDALNRTADIQRLRTLQAAAPGLQLREAVVMADD